MSLRRIIALAGVMLALTMGTKAQTVGIKSNLLMDATLNPQIGIEFGVAKHWTLELDYQINAWNIKNHKLKHYFITPEARWWYCEKFQGSFIGIHALGGQYNMGNIHNNFNFLGTHYSKLTDFRYEGWFVGGGISYGYAWALNKHWNIECEIGVGATYTKFDRYNACDFSCGDLLEKNGHHVTLGLTRLGLNVEYLF